MTLSYNIIKLNCNFISNKNRWKFLFLLLLFFKNWITNIVENDPPESQKLLVRVNLERSFEIRVSWICISCIKPPILAMIAHFKIWNNFIQNIYQWLLLTQSKYCLMLYSFHLSNFQLLNESNMIIVAFYIFKTIRSNWSFA